MHIHFDKSLCPWEELDKKIDINPAFAVQYRSRSVMCLA